jgi:hypothetical protein
MTGPVSVRLDPQVRRALTDAAKARGVGLSTYIRGLADADFKRLRKERIRACTREVAEYIAANPEAREFMEDWSGGPPMRGL